MRFDSTYILAGLGHADRGAVSAMLALYSSIALHRLVADQASDLTRRLRRRRALAPEEAFHNAFCRRVDQASREFYESPSSTGQLRLRIWMHLRQALGLPAALTFSRRGVPEVTSDIARRVSELYASQAYDDEVRKISVFSREYWKKHANRRLNPFADNQLEPVDFGFVVQHTAMATLAGAAERGDLAPDVKAQLVQRVRQAVNALDGQTRERLFQTAGIDDLTEAAALRILLGSGGLAGIGVAVEVSGFAAYILAAKASAIIPLVGGKTLVSTLAVISNPVLIVPVVVGGGLYLSRSVRRRVTELLSVPVASILALQAVAKGTHDVEPMLEVFRNLPPYLPKELLSGCMEEEAQAPRHERWINRSLDFMKGGARVVRRTWEADEFPAARDYLTRFEELGGGAVRS